MEDKKWGKVWAWVVLIALVAVGLYWGVLFAPFCANIKPIVSVRRYFYEKVLEKIYLPEQLPYSVMVREVGERGGKTEYGYTLMGRLVVIDHENDTLTLLENLRINKSHIENC